LHTRALAHKMSQKHQVTIITLMNRNEEKEKGKSFWLSWVFAAPLRTEYYDDQDVKVIKLGMNFAEKCCLTPWLGMQILSLPRALQTRTRRIISNFYERKISQLVSPGTLIHAINSNVPWLSQAALEVARKNSCPFVFTPVAHLYKIDRNGLNLSPHNDNQEQADMRITSNDRIDPLWLKTCREAGAVVTMTDVEKSFFTRNHINSSAETVGVGPIITEPPYESIRTKYALGDDPVVLFLGRNNRQKGIEELLLATQIVWQKYPRTRFLFVGPLEWGIERVFSNYSDERIIIFGAVDNARKSAILSTADILCIPSVDESFCGVFLEAWSFGKPIVGANIPPVRELTGDGKGGILITPTPGDIARGLTTLLKNPEKRRSMGQWGKATVQQDYSWEKVADRMEQIYSRVLREHKSC